ncbi:DNA polymerase IV [Paenibacillus sp. GCM10012307]|uniref:DNA polymerase IV n=1 Tax=Paenibacillus roseus TaxID=2798579 RepID=A0A934J9X1_9BACL|nr:DNA polymerase IV [Paenibacillus roseus]MBJ6363321.1 DNA polymerase IV [Paenibacillus roseus]
MERVIILADCQTFYASVEKAAHPEYKDMPLAVAGDPARRSGIILAACPIAKQRGVTTAQRLGEALGRCPELIIIRPRMQTYIHVSLLITEIYQRFTDLVEPYSIDEQFLDVTGSLRYFGTPQEIASQLQHHIWLNTGVWTRFGIGPNKVLAKMAADIWAKKKPEGIFTLPAERVEQLLWPKPIRQLFGVGSRMAAHFERMGILTIGELARLPLPELKRRMRLRMGRNSDIQAELYWQTARGIDPSPVRLSTHDQQQAVGHQMTLPRDYDEPADINVILLELSEEVCRRARARGFMGRVIGIGAQGADYGHPASFSGQSTLLDPTNITDEIYEAARKLFYRHWDGQPIRRIGVTLTGLSADSDYQLTLFGERDRKRKLGRTTDEIKARFGNTALLRASSLLEAAQAKERGTKIGGHYK